MANWFKKRFAPPKPTPANPRHYLEVSSKAPGERQSLELVRSEVQGPFVLLAYQWTSDLTYEEADNLDSRMRAYAACTIYDAAIESRLPCRAGPLHGMRPSWLIGDLMTPISLAEAGFRFSDKICELSVGPVVIALRDPKALDDIQVIAGALRGAYDRRFRNVSV